MFFGSHTSAPPLEPILDQKQAIATRLGILKTVAANKSLVAGMHLPFPGIGRVRVEGKGGYAWVPIEFGPLPKATNQ